MTAPLLVYKDRSANTWYWSCRVPFCGANEWAMGGQPEALNSAVTHLSRHRSVGFAHARGD